MSKTQRFTGKLGSRIGGRESGIGIEDRLKKNLKTKILNNSWIVVMSLWAADCR